MVQSFITDKLEEIAELCRKHHVRRLSVFGSAARADFDPERSDVDLLVDIEKLPYPLSAENYTELESRFTILFARPVDLVRDGSIDNPYLLREINLYRELLYAA